MKHTAVEWLEKRFLETEGNLYSEDFTKAKEIEGQQRVKDLKNGLHLGRVINGGYGDILLQELKQRNL